MNRFKKWLVLRWLGVLSPDELLTLAKDLKLNQQFNEWYQKLVDNMLQLYFEATPPKTKVNKDK